MRNQYGFFALVALALAMPSVIRADPPAAAPPGSANVGDVRVQNLKAYTYAFVSTQTSLNKLQDAIAELMPRIDAAMDSGALRPIGGVVFTYHGATQDPTKPFTLDIGVMVKDGNAKPDGIQLIKVGPLYCATVIYTGPAAQLGQAYGKLYGEIGRHGWQASDVSREVYLYWEGAESVNNVIQVQADLSPTN